MVSPYITLNGKCREAMELYQDVFDGEIKQVIPYGEYIPDGLENPPGDLSTWVLHAEMGISGCNFWFADETEQLSTGNMLKLAATVPDAVTGQECFDKLRIGGAINLPPTATHYSTFHAVVTDKYSVCWNIVADEIP